MRSSTRLLLNTTATYTRSVITIGLALFSSRWVLNSLGASDFGLFNLVGSLIVVIAYFNAIMAASSSRHLAYAIGNNNAEVNEWFNTSLSIHILLAAAVVVIGWPIGEYLIDNLLVIPPARTAACIQVFRISLVAAFINMISVPFVAMFTAKQEITELAVWMCLQALGMFAAAFVLLYVSYDRLIFYAASVVFVQLLTQISLIGRARSRFCECRVRFAHWWDRRRLAEVLSFAAWNAFGATGIMIRDQGAALLLNLRFGPSLNASFGIAKQVSGKASEFSAAMLTSFIPEITSREGRGQRAGMLSLAHRASTFAFALTAFFAIPLLWEVDSVLILWLKSPPEHTGAFCQLIIATFLIDRLTVGYMVAVAACGRIAVYQVIMGCLLAATIPLAWCFLWVGLSATSVVIAFVVTTSLCGCVRVYWLNLVFREPARVWFYKVFAPCCAMIAGGSMCVWIVQLMMTASLSRVVVTAVVNAVAISCTAWSFALDSAERLAMREAVFGAAAHIRRLLGA